MDFDEINAVIRAVTVEIENDDKRKQENVRVIQKLLQDMEGSIKASKSKSNTNKSRRPLRAVLTEDSQPVLLRSKRAAAKIASNKFKESFDDDTPASQAKRRCCIKVERLSVLDVISEEKEQTDSSPDVPVFISKENFEVDEKNGETCDGQVCMNVHPGSLKAGSNTSVIKPYNASVQRQDNLTKPEQLLHGDNVSSVFHGLLTDSTFVVDSKSINSVCASGDNVTIQSETLYNKDSVSFKNNKKQSSVGKERLSAGDVNKSGSADDDQNTMLTSTHANNQILLHNNKDSVQTESNLNCTYVKSSSGKQDYADEVVETSPDSNAEQKKNTNGSKNECCSVKMTNGTDIPNIKVVDLDKIIRESPVRVTRTKTRAMAAAAAAAAAVAVGSSVDIMKENLPSILSAEKIVNGKVSKNKPKTNNKKQANERLQVFSPPFSLKKGNSKVSPSENTKENQLNNTVDKNTKTGGKEFQENVKMKTPLGFNNNNNLSQSSKVNIIGVSGIVSQFETFITKTAKPNEDRRIQEERSNEAEKKKERLLKERVDHHKRLNEARAAKVAKTREQLEKQRLQQQQQQEREKEERMRQAMQKREEEIALKKQLAQQRAAEIEEKRKQEEAMRRKEQETEERMAEKKAQLKNDCEKQVMPTETEKVKEIKSNITTQQTSKIEVNASNQSPFSKNDIYSSGDESEDEEITIKKVFPRWTTGQGCEEQLRLQQIHPDCLPMLFQSKQTTPDLREIFGSVPAKMLVRSSSAIWNSP